jgi:excisionase family DNA binding protein
VTEAIEVTVTAADYWASRPQQLAQLLTTAAAPGGTRTIADPSGRPPDPSRFAVVTAPPAAWRDYPRELEEALSGADASDAPASRAAAGAVAPMNERLTLTVEEAGTLLGISRALAYEAGNREDIPSIRIGRRILVPKAAIQRLVGATAASD